MLHFPSFCIFISHSIIFIFSFLSFSSQLLFLAILSGLINLIVFFSENWTSIFIVLKHLVSSILVEVVNITCFNTCFLELIFSFFYLEIFHFLSVFNLYTLFFLDFLWFTKGIFFSISFILFMFFEVFHYDSIPLLFSWIQLKSWICVVNFRSLWNTGFLTHHIRLSCATSHTRRVRLNRIDICSSMSLLRYKIRKSFIYFTKLSFVRFSLS